MDLLFTLLTLVVVALVVAVVMGRIPGGLPDETTSIPAVGLPETTLDVAHLDAVRLAPALRGYRMDQVDEVLDRVTLALAERDQVILAQQAQIEDLRRQVGGSTVAGDGVDSLGSTAPADRAVEG